MKTVLQDIGSLLRAGRMAKGLSISDIAKTTCISARYLHAMEEGKFHAIPNVFDKGYLRIYASMLGMDVGQILALYEQNKQRINTRQASNPTTC